MDIDLFGGPSKIKLNSKWNISNYISTPGSIKPAYSTTATDGISQDLKVELDRAIKAIEIAYSKSALDFDKIFRDLATRRKELKALMTELQATAKPVDIAALWGVESNLIVNQIRALENKQKIESEKFKQIRDEKKLARDKAGGSEGGATNNGVTNIISNSPLSTSEQIASQGRPSAGISVGSLPKDLLIKSVQSPEEATVVEPVPVIEHKETVPIPTPKRHDVDEYYTGETTAQQTVVTPPSEVKKPSFEGSDIIVSTDLIGKNSETVADLQSGMMDRVNERLKHREEMLGEAKTMTGYNYQHSLDTLTTKALPHVERMYVCPATGTYYTKAFTTDENGEYTKEIPNFNLKSVVHLGKVQFNPLHKKCQFYYYPDNKDYELVEDLSDMPEFYKKEWDNPKNDKYVLDQDTISMLIEAENK